RIGTEAALLKRAKVGADEIAVLGRDGSLVTRSGKAVTEDMPIQAVIRGTGSTVARTGRLAQGAGVAAMADNGEYMAEHWSDMSTGQKWEQGGMFLANL